MKFSLCPSIIAQRKRAVPTVVGRLKIFFPSKKVIGRNLKEVGNLDQGADGRFPLPAFVLADNVLAEAAELAECFAVHTPPLPEGLQALGETIVFAWVRGDHPPLPVTRTVSFAVRRA